MKHLKDMIFKDFSKEFKITASDLMAKYKISRPAVFKHLKALRLENKILKQGSGLRNTYYILNTPAAKKKFAGKIKKIELRLRAAGLEEDKLFKKIETQAGFLDHLSENAKKAFHFVFTEMVNNAIEHSGTKLISVKVTADNLSVTFTVDDTGIGIFENISQKKHLNSEMEAIQDLLKGKQTTKPENHSGEGIFFSSKISDNFILESHKKRLRIDNSIEDIFVEDIRFKKGTRVFVKISASSQKELFALFQKYTSEDFSFNKSRIEVKLYQGKDSYVSRSQARRLLHSLDQFKEILLDFKGVPSVGQAFADEIFRVFKNSHPDIKIDFVNAAQNVEFMIRRALAPF